jgi:glycosyltransferase involved in cell wall biosynthesis
MSSDRLKVLCIIDTIRTGGGAEQLLVDLLPEMQRLGVDVEVAALFHCPEDLGADLERQGITVHRLNLSSRFSLIDAARKLLSLLRYENFDVFWGHLYYGNFYASLTRMLSGRGAVVTTIHSVGYSQSPPIRIRDRVSVEIERYVLSSADRCVAVSEAVRQDYAAYFGISDILVVHNGINCCRLGSFSLVNSHTARSDFGFSPEEFLVVTPASFVAKKGHQVWIDAIEILRDADGLRPRVMLCGDGPLIEAVGAEISRRGLSNQVTVSPVIAHEKLLPLIAASNAVVMPSLREPFGIAAAEAMALGVACVLSDVDGFRELTASADCAILVPPGDPEALALAIKRLHEDPRLRADLAKRGQAHVRSLFDINVCAKRWVSILQGSAESDFS